MVQSYAGSFGSFQIVLSAKSTAELKSLFNSGNSHRPRWCTFDSQNATSHMADPTLSEWGIRERSLGDDRLAGDSDQTLNYSNQCIDFE